jgi:DUF1680 family protein
MARPGFRRIFPEFAKYDPLYSQSHLPIREQATAEGHSVRALYMYSAMADIAEEYSDSGLLECCRTLWNNIVQKRMYITGSVGSSGFWERFTVDYDLPNDINYSETCASIALAMFGQRMAAITGDASYFDTVERALYNTVRSGISLEGDRYFYVNPLEVRPEACLNNTSRAHVKAVRQKWYDCSCCPTNIARTFAGLGQYIYFVEGKNLFVNLFVQNEASFEIGGKPVTLSLKTDYPKTGDIHFSVKAAEPFSLNIRVPHFAEEFSASINGSPVQGQIKNNYFHIADICGGDEIAVHFSLEPRFVYANPRVPQNCGKVAVARGPEIFCLEEADNGKNLPAVSIDTSAQLRECWRDDILGGIMTIKANGKKLIIPEAPESFSEKFTPEAEDAELILTPYSFWGNRSKGSPGEMMVWILAE